MNTKVLKYIAVAAMVLSMAGCNQKQQKADESTAKKEKKSEIYQWRYDRTGIYAEEKGLLTEWPENGPEVIWETEEIGYGYGSPTITNDKVFIQGSLDSTGYLFSFDMNGKLLWKSSYGTEWVKNYPGSRAAPTVVDNLIYVCSGMGVVSCFDAETGKQKWAVDMVNQYGGIFPMFGFSEAILVDGDKAFCMPGGSEHNMLALNRFTGELIWSNKGMGERSAYNQPTIIEHGEKKIVATFSAYHLLGFDSETGELLWSHEQTNTSPDKRKLGLGDTHSNTILYDYGFIYYVEGDGLCTVKLKLSADGKSITQVWQNPEFDNYMGGFVKLGNYLYGAGTHKPYLYTVDVNTGMTTNKLKLGNGVTISAEGMLYCYTFAGIVALVDPNNGTPEVVSKFKYTKGENEHFAHPVIDKGRLYVRHGPSMQVFDIKKKS